MPQLPGYRGRVFLRDFGQFYGQDETLNLEPEQLPQFLPRTEWPERSQPRGPYLDDMPLSRNEFEVLELHPERLKARDKWDSDNPDLPPMPPYRYASNSIAGPSRPCYSGTSIWQDHAMILYHCLVDTIGTNDWLSEDEVTELLTCVSYGMHQSMTWLPAWAFEPGNEGCGPFVKVQNGDFDAPMVQCGDFDVSCFDSRAPILKRMLGRRWIAVPINQSFEHWFMTLFDRKAGQLFIFDSFRPNREDRIEAATHMWAKFWREMGLPWHFQYFVAPVEQQSQDWECGLLAVAWVIAALRDRAGGTRFLATDQSVPAHDITMYHTDVPHPYPKQDSSIPLPDWLPPECNSANDGVDAVRRMFQIIIANELGLKNDKSMKATRFLPGTESDLSDGAARKWYANIGKQKAQKSFTHINEDSQETTEERCLDTNDFVDGVGGLLCSRPVDDRLNKYDSRDKNTPRPDNVALGSSIDQFLRPLNTESMPDTTKIQYVCIEENPPPEVTPNQPAVDLPASAVQRNPFVATVVEAWCVDVMENTCRPNDQMLDIAYRYLTSEEAPSTLRAAVSNAKQELHLGARIQLDCTGCADPSPTQQPILSQTRYKPESSKLDDCGVSLSSTSSAEQGHIPEPDQNPKSQQQVYFRRRDQTKIHESNHNRMNISEESSIGTALEERCSPESSNTSTTQDQTTAGKESGHGSLSSGDTGITTWQNSGSQSRRESPEFDGISLLQEQTPTSRESIPESSKSENISRTQKSTPCLRPLQNTQFNDAPRTGKQLASPS